MGSTTDYWLTSYDKTTVSMKIPLCSTRNFSPNQVMKDHPVSMEEFWPSEDPDSLQLFAARALIFNLIHPKRTYWNDEAIVENRYSIRHFSFKLKDIEHELQLAQLKLPPTVYRDVKSLVTSPCDSTGQCHFGIKFCFDGAIEILLV